MKTKVFKILWPEPAGDLTGKATIVSDPEFGEAIASKIRWFVVVKEGNNSCSCLWVSKYKFAICC
jgi:hypothetical protein